MHNLSKEKGKYSPGVNHEGNTRFVKDLENKTLVGYKYFAFGGKTNVKVVTRGASGIFRVMTEPEKIVAEIPLGASGKWKESKSVSFMAEGVKTLHNGLIR